MNRIIFPRSSVVSHLILILGYVLYIAIFILAFQSVGLETTPFAIITVVGGGWYFGIRGGIIMAIVSTLTNTLLLVLFGHHPLEYFRSPGFLADTFTLLFSGIIIGQLGNSTRARRKALIRLEELEKERRARVDFLDFLNGITAKALEADNLHDTLEILTEKVTQLHKADDGFFTIWDEERGTSIPAVAYGSMKEVYPQMKFEPGEQTLAAKVMKAGYPIAVPDVKNSPYISPNIAALFPSRSVLGLPLIVQRRKMGALILSYNTARQFDDSDIARAKITAEHVALVLSKSQLLEEERKQVRQLSALHDVALTSVEAEDEDQLIERVTEIIGRNLFPDNFGILLLDEKSEALRPHPSYRHYNSDIQMKDMQPGEGITGEVAKTGRPQLIGDVLNNPQYVNIDSRTLSELCVPIKFKEHVLGVINAESTKKDAFTVDDERLLATLAGQLATAIEQLRAKEAEREWLDQLAHSNDLIFAIAQITTQIEKALTIDEITQTLGKELRRIDLTCIMAVHDPKRALFTINYTSLPPDYLEIVEKGLGYPLVNYTFSRSQLNQLLKRGDIRHPIAMPNPEEEILTLFTNAEKPGIVRILGEIGVAPGIEPLRLPLIFEDNLLGMLWTWGAGIRKSDLPIMTIFAKQIGVSLERARLFQEVQSLAFTDPLTGLHNRRSLFELGKIEFLRAHRFKRPFCCMMLDLDHFKKINDNYGHPTGDQILKEFARRCRLSVREIDLVSRYGGEEIVILLPETAKSAAVDVAERLRASIAGTPATISDQEIKLTASIGVAAKDENTGDLETLIARADQAMYIAKHRGRNRVAVSS